VAREARRALKAQAELDWAADGIAGEAMTQVRVDPGLQETAFHTRRRQLEHMLRSRVGPIPEPYTVKDSPRTDSAEPPSRLADHQTVRPIAPPAFADRHSNGHIEQPTLADQPRNALTGQPSTLGDDPGTEPVEDGLSTEPVEEPSTLGDDPGAEQVDEPSTVGVRPQLGSLGPRSALELQLLTARVPAMSNAGRVTALAVVAGVALALVVWGVG
jgi:hypothetical protein